MITKNFTELIGEASNVVGKTFPLYAFVTSNPLAGYEKESFFHATESAQKYSGGSFYPQASVYQQALDAGEIERDLLKDLLVEHGFIESPAFYLQEIRKSNPISEENANHQLDTIMVKWLTAFLDEGTAEWEMPNRENGFFNAWRSLAKYDKQVRMGVSGDIPTSAEEALQSALKAYSDEHHLGIFEYHISALPGWTGYIKYRVENNTDWQQKYPILLTDYLAVRLWLCENIGGQMIAPSRNMEEQTKRAKLQYVWLTAWEKSLQNNLVQKIVTNVVIKEDKLPDAQLVFCIDSRSELIRRHIEEQGNYETFGFAGFFGIAADYKDSGTGFVRKSCPPIVPSAYIISEKSTNCKSTEMAKFRKASEDLKFQNYFLKRLKNMLPSAFGYVEGSGLIYGVSLVLRSLFPARLYLFNQKNETIHEHFCDTRLDYRNETDGSLSGIPLSEQVAIVHSAFAIMGWRAFAALVVFAGHGSHSKNNPFASSLDCGACAASPGRNNARMLAGLANLPEVRASLAKDFKLFIPSGTVFIGAEHNTTTEAITLFDQHIPASHLEELRALKASLKKVQEKAIKERRGVKEKAFNYVYKKANNWAETRPEWGLAKNAAFIIGPRSLSKNINLENRCFLQSYDWKMDNSGAFLEAIMQGPMTVTQWINSHYYFSTVDNDRFGGGSKITHNVSGQFGVVQGNGGDLKIGIPLQSVMASDEKMFHQPLRLTVIIEAPSERLIEILNRNPALKNLITNHWIYLMVMDPITGAKPRIFMP
ncbi:uncharacterized protein YbcC (UPF0753/DUF2309 family) [Pedobacter sp. UYEF25]